MSSFSSWKFPPDDLKLANKAVHVWVASLCQPDDLLAEFEKTLSADELKRAMRFRFPRDKNRFMAGRGILRELLGRYLALAPAQIDFVYGTNGKPALRGANSLRFNLAHSGDAMLCAFSLNREIGIDLEQMAPLTDAGKIAERFFSSEENMALGQLDELSRENFFYRTWTRREAVLKCGGQGIDETFEQENLLKTFKGRVCELRPLENYFAALAVDGPSFELETWTWPEYSLKS